MMGWQAGFDQQATIGEPCPNNRDRATLVLPEHHFCEAHVEQYLFISDMCYNMSHHKLNEVVLSENLFAILKSVIYAGTVMTSFYYAFHSNTW